MHCFAFPPLCTFLLLYGLALVLHCSVPVDLIWGAQSCGIPSAAGDRQPEPQAGPRGTQPFPEAGSGM